MEDGDFNSLIEGLGSGSGSLLVTQQNHYVVSNTFISAEQPFPTPSPSPSIILRSPVGAVPPPSPQPPARSPAPSPARPTTPQSTITQYSSIAPNSNQLVQLFPSQGSSLVGRTQILQTTTTQQTAQLKGKQPQQILPKPLTPGAVAKQAVARMTPTISQQSGQLLINQPQAQNQTLLLNQVLTSGGPVLVQPASGSGTVHLMLRPPTPTLQAGPGSTQGKVVIGSPAPHQQQTVLIQQNRQQIMRIMTPQGPMQMQIQAIQTPNGPQYLAIPTNQTLAFPSNSMMVQAPSIMQQQVQQHQPQQHQRIAPNVDQGKKKPLPKKPKPIKIRSDSSASPPSSREDLSPPVVSPKITVLSSPMHSPPPPPIQKAMTSSLRQIRPTAFARKQTNDSGKDGKGEEGGKPPVVDNLTATINSVAENTKSPMEDMLSGTQNLNLNKRPNLTIFQKARPDSVQAMEPVVEQEDRRKPVICKKTPAKKKGKKDEGRLDLWDIMKSAGIGDEECDETPTEVHTESIELAGADSDLLAQLQGSLRLAVGEDGRPLLIDSSGVLIAEQSTSQMAEESSVITLKPQGRQTPGAEPPIITLTPHGAQTPGSAHASSGADGPVISLTPQALATAQSQLTQLLQDHGAVTAADQQLLAQIFTVNPSQGLGGINLSQQNEGGSVLVSSRGTATESSIQQSQQHQLQQSQQQQAQHQQQQAQHQQQQAQHQQQQAQQQSQQHHQQAQQQSQQHHQQAQQQSQHHQLQQSQQQHQLQQHQQQLHHIQQVEHTQQHVTARLEPSNEFISAPPPGLPPLGPDSLVITNNNGVPTLVASPALLQYLQTHQGIIQFQHDPITKTITPSLIIPHPPPQQSSQPSVSVGDSHQMRNDARLSPRSATNPPKPADSANGNKVVGSATSLANIVRNQAVGSGVKMSMARIIQENPSLLQIARETNGFITQKETCPNLTEAQLTELDKKILANRTLLDQCFHMELENLHNPVDIAIVKGYQGPPSANSPNSEFQNKFLESIGMPAPLPKTSVSVGTGTPPAAPSPAVVAQPPPQPTVIVQQPPPQVVQPPASNKKSRKKKAAEKAVEHVPQPVQTLPPPQGNLTFNIKQLTPEQNERLNIALNQRGITANQVAMNEMTDLEKQIIEEEIRRVTGGALGNATVKFFPPPSASQPSNNTVEEKVNAATMARFYPDEELEVPQQQSAMVVNNPNLNHLLDTPVGTQLVSLGNPIHSGNQVVTLGSPPAPGSVIVGSNGNVVAIVQQSVQLTAQKQQMLKSIQAQMQALQSKLNRTPSDQVTLQKLAVEQQKILASGKIVSSSPHPSHPFQIVSQAGGQPRMYQQTFTTSKPGSASVSCGTSTSDIGVGPGGMKPPVGKMGQPMILVADPGVQYGPLYVSPNAPGKVMKCEKGTSPIQIQMGTQTGNSMDYRGSKITTGTMTSPNTGKPQAVVAPAIVHMQQSEPPPVNTTWIKQQRRCPSPVITVSRTTLIEKQLAADQAGAVRPDTHTPYLSKSDAVKRLMRYHVMDDKGLCEQDLRAADDMFETTAQHLLDKFRLMKEKYKYLLLMESMRETSTAERIMVDRNFIIEERIELEDLREKEKREQEEFERAPPQLLPVDTSALKTEIKEEELDPPKLELSEDDIMSPGSHTNDEKSSSSCLPDISAQVQSAIDSILNLQKSEEPEDERRKRKRPRTGTTSGGGKRGRRRDGEDDEGNVSDQDPVLDEAIRSILTS